MFTHRIYLLYLNFSFKILTAESALVFRDREQKRSLRCSLVVLGRQHVSALEYTLKFMNLKLFKFFKL